MIILAISGIMITIKLKFEGEKGRLVLPFAIIIVCAICCAMGCYCDRISCERKLKRGEEYFAQVTEGIEDTQIDNFNDCVELACMVHFLYLQYESHEKERVLVIVHSRVNHFAD